MKKKTLIVLLVIILVSIISFIVTMYKGKSIDEYKTALNKSYEDTVKQIEQSNILSDYGINESEIKQENIFYGEDGLIYVTVFVEGVPNTIIVDGDDVYVQEHQTDSVEIEIND